MATKKKPIADEPAAAEAPPTVDEAKAMFSERPDLASVLTDAGWLFRDGRLEPEALLG